MTGASVSSVSHEASWTTRGMLVFAALARELGRNRGLACEHANEKLLRDPSALAAGRICIDKQNKTATLCVCVYIYKY